jgi:hypothetical protein
MMGRYLRHVRPNSLNGNKRIELISLKTRLMVRPAIRKGSRISQMRGKRMSRSNARGQHNASKINQRITAINVRMMKSKSKFQPNSKIAY